MLEPGANVGPVHAVVAEQQLGHPRDRRRAVDLQIRNPAGALVPALEHEPAVVHAMVVVQVAEERVRHVDGAMAALDAADDARPDRDRARADRSPTSTR